MKRCSAFVGILIGLTITVMGQTPNSSPSTQVYRASEAKSLIGKYAVIVGTVVQVRPSEKIFHINFEKPFPYHEFTAVVFGNRTNLFPNLEKLVGSRVEVSGKVEAYKDKPQIILQSPKQLRIILAKSEESKAEK